MWTNYLKIALRRLIGNKLYTLTNLVGLSIGFAAVLIIFLFVQKEKSFDKFHDGNDRLYRLIRVTNSENADTRSVRTSAAISTFIKSDLPQIEAVTRYSNGGVVTYPDSLTYNKQNVKLNIKRVDTDFFNVFSFGLLLGEYPDYELQPNSTVLTESLAKDIFGSTKKALGEKISIGKSQWTIVGVLEDVPTNSSIQFNIASSYVEANKQFPFKFTDWRVPSIETVYKFSKGITDEQKAEVLKKITEEHNLQDKQGSNIQYASQAVKDIHFDVKLVDGVANKIDPSYLTIFSLIALIVLISSVTNYASLTLSQSVERVKEIGIRKTIGAEKWQLLLIYFVESLVLTSLSFVLGLIIVEALVPQLELLLGRNLGIDLFGSPSVLFGAYCVAILTALISTAYPALIVSSKNLTDLRGSAKRSSLFNKSFFIDLVNGFQVAVFLFLISATVFINKQFHFIQNENLGFDKDQVVVVNVNTRESIFKKEALKAEFAKSPYVSSQSLATTFPSQSRAVFYNKELDINYAEYQVEADYVNVLDLELIEGRMLEDIPSNKDYVLINESAAKVFSNASAIGKKFNGKEVIGIVKDFHFESKQSPIRPLAIRLFDNDGFGNLLVKLKGESPKEALADLLDRFDKVTGSTNFKYSFLDERYDRMYSSEMVILRVIGIFTSVALLIAVMGILGSSAYTVKRKIKEVSIKKVLGASLLDITSSINARGLLRMILGALVAVPLAYLCINNWLNDFAYHIDLELIAFVPIIGLAALVILPAMGIHTTRAFFANTIDHLKED
ncbi:ABC transporter permease [Roseivirga misakiensis]|uniref:ABC transporter permease n=1 Tax=Roseivirga misakiensis TaxID=1563681 RepID=A0A1E5T066_9BACT|nr:ABC transporter permease [Roseivirga misakiensis]OEK04763.1 hypothetical protein BFP71_15060 [Roseivirga misakiensis]